MEMNQNFSHFTHVLVILFSPLTNILAVQLCTVYWSDIQQKGQLLAALHVIRNQTHPIAVQE